VSAAAASIQAGMIGVRAGPRLVIARHVARSAARWAIVWGIVFGLYVVATVRAFIAGYPTLAERRQVAESLRSFALLLGDPHHLETVAGFTQWRLLMAAAIIGAIWGLRASTGLLRGEEDAGRWELLLAGRTTRRGAAVQALLGLGAALSAMFVATALLTLAAGALPGARFPPVRSLLLAVDLVAGAAMFLTIGAVTSQLSATRGQAASLATAVLGAAYAVRVVADSWRGLAWLRWLSPFGWLEELRPLRDPQPVALLPIVALVIAGAGLTALLAGRRDLNGSVLREGEGRLRDVRWLRGPFTLALRLSRGSALGWLAGVAALSFVYGTSARSAIAIFNSSSAFTRVLRSLGARQGALGYFGVVYFVVMILIAVLAATQIAAIRDEEASGRLDNLLVRPVRRLAWLAGRLGIALGLIVAAGAVAGLVTWASAAGQHTGVGLPKLLEAGINATIPGVFVLGAGTLLLGVRPRLASTAAYAIVAYSFLVYLLGSLVKNSDWLRDSSLFAHVAMAPAVKPDWSQAIVLVLLGAAAAGLGALAFQRRDVAYA
jgi:ABC-2 type transport system permease protein